VALVIAVALDLLTRRLDSHIIANGLDLPRVLNRGGAEDMRSVLATIAGASITTLGLVLSLTMVTLSIAATQLGPRLIRNFLATRATKWTIGLFTGLFVYALLVLDSISATVADGLPLLPNIGTSVALLGSIAAVVSLLWYVNTVAVAVQVPSMLELVVERLRWTLRTTRHDQLSASGRRDPAEVAAEWADRRDPTVARAEPIVLDTSGYLQQIDHPPLVEAARRHDAVVVLLARPGDFVARNMPIAMISPPEAAPALTHACARHIDVGPHRTLDQDVEYAVDQLVEVALRALSPAVNDTFTALTCLDWLSDALRELAENPPIAAIHCDPAGHIRVVERTRHLERVVKAGYEKIRQVAVGNPAVIIRLLGSIERVVPAMADPDGRRELGRQADLAVQGSLAAIGVEGDRADVRAAYRRVIETLARPA
jgi:uncharacterized membrane protein